MSGTQTPIGNVKIVGPEEGESFWQPVPANGFVRNLLSQKLTGSEANFSIGMQTVAPGCLIREHTHSHNEEVIVVIEGRGFARVEGVDHPIERGSAVFLGLNRRHHFINPGPEPLTFIWFFMPGGLDAFFAEIGRQRMPGEPAPAPFPRPQNIAEIERRTGFGWTDKAFDTSKAAP
jgi:mannose-6-phosphate isomerase-like protein (cupin superfamily)